LDILKIDKAFIADLASGPNSVTLLRAMLELGHSLGLSTVVEGVESAGQLDTLRGLECDFVQGYLLGTPGSAPEITAMLQRASTRNWTLVQGREAPAPVHSRQ
jgi:EAL domain-containing protein (putative c-di-GMP-specific phosphodiesterase class I)